MRKISLNKIASENLTDRQMKAIKGGTCYCGCCNVSSIDNGSANVSNGLSSPSTCEDGSYWLPEVTVTPG
jgi:natural product precursor